MTRALGRERAKITTEIAAARGFKVVSRRRDAGLVKDREIDFVTADFVLGGSIERLRRTGLIVAHHVGHGLDPAGANHVKEPARKFGKQRADASASDHERSGASEEERQLPHPVEIHLQSGQENDGVLAEADRGGIKRPAPHFMIERDCIAP